MTIDMNALLERATADCLDSSDLEEFCAALIRRIVTLETMAREVISDLTLDQSDRCPVCDAHLRYQLHGRGCSLRDLAATLEDA